MIIPQFLEKITASLTTPLRDNSEDTQKTLETLYNALQLRRLTKAAGNQPIKLQFEAAMRACEKLVSRLAIAEHRVTGLTRAVKHNQMKGKQGKQLDLKGDPAGGAAIWSAREVVLARDYQASKQATLEAEKAQRDVIKAQKARDKAAREAGQKERCLQCEIDLHPRLLLGLTKEGKQQYVPTSHKEQPQSKKLVHKVSEARSRAIEGNGESDENDLDGLSLLFGEMTLEAEKTSRSGCIICAPRI